MVSWPPIRECTCKGAADEGAPRQPQRRERRDSASRTSRSAHPSIPRGCPSRVGTSPYYRVIADFDDGSALRRCHFAARARTRVTIRRWKAIEQCARARRDRLRHRRGSQAPCLPRCLESSETRRHVHGPAPTSPVGCHLVAPVVSTGHRSTLATAHAAPKPLSIPTTVIPAAHEACMASNAVTPPARLHKPTLVWCTRSTGAGVKPATRLGRALPIPAMTITTSAFRDGFDRREEAMYTGHPAVAEQRRREAESAKDSSAFLGHRKIAGPGRADEHAPIPIRLLSPNDRERRPSSGSKGVRRLQAKLRVTRRPVPVSPSQQDWTTATGGEQLGNDLPRTARASCQARRRPQAALGEGSCDDRPSQSPAP